MRTASPGSRTAGTGTNGDRAPTVPTLLRELADEGTDLVRQEVALVRAEMREKMDVWADAAGSMAVGAALLLAALLTLLWTLNRGLTALLAAAVGVEVAVWLSPLLLTVTFGAVGWSMLNGGRKRIRREGLTPETTRSTLKTNARWAKDKAQELKEETTRG